MINFLNNLKHIFLITTIALLPSYGFSKNVAIPEVLVGKTYEGYINIHVPKYKKNIVLKNDAISMDHSREVKAQDHVVHFKIEFRGKKGFTSLFMKDTHATLSHLIKGKPNKRKRVYSPIKIEKAGDQKYKITVFKPYKKYKKKTFSDYTKHEAMFNLEFNTENLKTIKGSVNHLSTSLILGYHFPEFKDFELYNRADFSAKEIREKLKKIQ